MHIRCTQCKSLTPVQVPAASGTPAVVSCSGCGKRYRLAVNRPGRPADEDRYRRASEYAEANHIDMAGAYSILEGVMTLEEARALRGSAPAPAREPLASPLPAKSRMERAKDQVPNAAPTVRSRVVAVPTPSTSPVPPPAAPPSFAVRRASPPKPGLTESDKPYDHAFGRAVADGFLSVQQAVERGDRRALALRVSQRHRLPMDLALMVADNRVSVRQALEQKAAREAKEPPPPQTSVSHGVWNFMVFSIGTMILTGLLIHMYHVWGEYLTRNGAVGLEETVASAAERPPAPPPAAAAPPPPLTVPRTDSTGQLVEVAGPDPGSVLVSFCATGRQAGLREPVEVAPAVPPSSGLRFGVFRSLEQPGTPLRAIRIRQDAKTGRWLAGDGRGPIMTETPPQQPPGARTIPIARAGS